MPLENGKKYSPPYISPRTFYNLLEQLQETVPGRIDRSYLDTRFSGGISTQIMAALRFMNLIDSKNVPTHHLRLLVAARDEEREKRLKDLCNNAYGIVFTNGTIDTQIATYAQLEEVFQFHFGVDGDVRRKCIKFFTSLATDAGIPLSPHITDKVRNTPVNNSTRATVKKAPNKAPEPEVVPKTEKPAAHHPALEKLLEKFPVWDANWTDEQNARWREGLIHVVKSVHPELNK